MALFSHFLIAGWNPDGINLQSIDEMTLIEVGFEGEYEQIPQFDDNSMHFYVNQESKAHLIEMPLTLTVGGEYPDKLYFMDHHWVQINSVTLCDMRVEMDKVWESPLYKKHVSLEELIQQKVEFEEQFSKVCPKGMHYIVIEYECEEGISIQFYSKRWLDAEVAYQDSAMVFLMDSDTPTGKHGMPLKLALIEEPVTEEISTIEVDLFQYHQTD